MSGRVENVLRDAFDEALQALFEAYKKDITDAPGIPDGSKYAFIVYAEQFVRWSRGDFNP